MAGGGELGSFGELGRPLRQRLLHLMGKLAKLDKKSSKKVCPWLGLGLMTRGTPGPTFKAGSIDHTRNYCLPMSLCVWVSLFLWGIYKRKASKSSHELQKEVLTLFTSSLDSIAFESRNSTTITAISVRSSKPTDRLILTLRRR